MHTLILLLFSLLPLLTRADFVTVAKAEGLNTLVSVLEASGLAPALQSGASDITVLGPNDQAFAQLPAEVLQLLTKKYNVDILTKILLYHVFGDDFSSTVVTSLVGQQSPPTLEGSTIAVSKPGATLVLNGNANVIKADVPFTNQNRVGVLHVLDRVLVPPQLQIPTQTIAGLLTQLWGQGQFLQFRKYASKFGNQLPDLLNTMSDSGFTVFLPSDAAFANFPKRFDQNLDTLANRKCKAELRFILFFHVVRGYFPSSSLKNGQQLTTLFDPKRDRLRVQLVNGNVRIERSIVTQANIRASNGVVHVINKVLIPSQ